MGIWDKLSNSADEIAAALKNQVTQKDISNLIDNAIEFGNEIRGKVDLEGYYKLIKDNKVWNDFVESNPSVPKNLDEVAELKDFLLDQVHTLKIPQYLKDRGVIKEINLKSTQLF
ncbi:MAG: hypothetical protein R2753_11970 [Chitinophagales bacterium]